MKRAFDMDGDFDDLEEPALKRSRVDERSNKSSTNSLRRLEMAKHCDVTFCVPVEGSNSNRNSNSSNHNANNQDVEFKEYQCFKLLFAMKSEYFEEILFEKGMVGIKDKIKLEGIDCETFEFIKDWCYSETNSITTKKNVLKLLNAAYKYRIEDLFRACTDFVEKQFLSGAYRSTTISCNKNEIGAAERNSQRSRKDQSNEDEIDGIDEIDIFNEENAEKCEEKQKEKKEMHKNERHTEERTNFKDFHGFRIFDADYYECASRKLDRQSKDDLKELEDMIEKFCYRQHLTRLGIARRTVLVDPFEKPSAIEAKYPELWRLVFPCLKYKYKCVEVTATEYGGNVTHCEKGTYLLPTFDPKEDKMEKLWVILRIFQRYMVMCVWNFSRPAPWKEVTQPIAIGDEVIEVLAVNQNSGKSGVVEIVENQDDAHHIDHQDVEDFQTVTIKGENDSE